MKAPFGKRNKSAEDNADCFIKGLAKCLFSDDGSKITKKNAKQSVKYITRMKEIIDGKFPKCPNTFTNMTKIVETVSHHAELLTRIYARLDIFDDENEKALISIYKELMKVELDPHPLSQKLSEQGNDYINELIEKLEGETKENNYLEILKASTYQPELHRNFLRNDVLQKLSDNMANSDAHVAMNSSELLEQILVSDTHQDIVSKYAGENYEAIMEVLKSLINHEVITTQIQGLNLLAELLNRCGSIKEFSEKYLQDPENLKMVMNKLTDENRDVKDATFELLLCNIFTPKDMKSDEVNDCLLKNCDHLIELIEEDAEKLQDVAQIKRRKEAVEWLSKIKLNL